MMLQLTLVERIWEVLNNRKPVPPRYAQNLATSANTRHVPTLCSLTWREYKQKNIENHVYAQQHSDKDKINIFTYSHSIIPG